MQSTPCETPKKEPGAYGISSDWQSSPPNDLEEPFDPKLESGKHIYLWDRDGFLLSVQRF